MHSIFFNFLSFKTNLPKILPNSQRQPNTLNLHDNLHRTHFVRTTNISLKKVKKNLPKQGIRGCTSPFWGKIAARAAMTR